MSANVSASGCSHYRRHCHVRAECCQQWVACRLCHNEQFTDHEIDRHAIRIMRCDACLTEQPCARTCSKCEAVMGAYFCQVCNLFDDAGDEKQVFHCDGCGICRVGGRDNFFHCDKCCGCYPHSLQNKHKCLEGSMHRECAICLEVTFASLESVHVLPCGHVLHGGCWEEYISHGCI
uniref:CHY-type domain-containing protein n=1 Tax=Globisporangium ultimum (strain ATCC 200006 / CBS 805.95 / DAOM BR144) TaxID=431595 RepID=K3WB58_GLOUD